ncbi:CASP-like protein SELMODRAFT_413556 [Selaginella moellendorffii]|uniref:CASP-like protein SELMODRAFT_413556 n=1 Tax=Selaginella moellendorffii TaxID=88036 RepID=UPI000D1CED77|nr:CASP-like protein SELMODRAFT_413556 [Selaginella moellendorffii]|eukprot:XP_024538914.1 CASP-like protein SELMODRAFT_413556 [Selaginella moellendorffii]
MIQELAVLGDDAQALNEAFPRREDTSWALTVQACFGILGYEIFTFLNQVFLGYQGTLVNSFLFNVMAIILLMLHKIQRRPKFWGSLCYWTCVSGFFLLGN